MRSRAAVVAVLVSGLAAIARGDDAENRARLEAMPREQRVQLSKTLDEYDLLPAADRQAVRDLDAAIARLDPVVQARYRNLLRRYHVWVNGLDDDQRAQLAKAATSEAKLALVAKWRKAEREADTRARRNMIFGVHPGDLGTLPPVEMANALRVWLKLDEKERADVEKLERLPERLNALRNLGRQKKIVGRPFRDEVEETLVGQLKDDEKITSAFPKWVTKREKKADADAAKKPATLMDPLHQLAESLYFAQNPPQPVTPANLALFESQVPGWLRATLDPLPPDDARRRLVILYRQIYPPGQEIPPPPKPSPDASKAKPAARPAPPGPPPGPSL